MSPVRAVTTLVLAGCGVAAAPAGPPADARAPDAREPDASIDALAPYRHTILIDGVDDFTADEQFATTSAGYAASVTWDEHHLYLAYRGADLDPTAPGTATKWLFAYVDFDPGTGSGATTSLRYTTQEAAFPAGFGAELYVRWKCDGALATVEQRLANGTYKTIATPTAQQAGPFVEVAIPRVLLGGSARLGLVTWMINEQQGLEGSYAGLYADNFVDGYAASLPLTKYLIVDFAAARPPNDPENQAP